MKTQALSGAPDGLSALRPDAIYRRVHLRLLPLLFICYIAAYLDRVNVGFAKLQMQASLGFSDSVYGLGAGIFFIGYFLFEVPSNLWLHRVGARRWIARIMVSWGLLSVGTMFVNSPMSFYVLRFLLGAAEAGFFPGVILYLTYWYPAERRSRATSLFLSALAFAGILGGPSAGWILHNLQGVRGWQGWQWLFLLQGLPSVVLGLVVWRCLDDRVEEARWLSEAERRVVAADIARDAKGKLHPGLKSILLMPRVWLLALIYFALVAGVYCLSFWSPSLIAAAGVKDVLQVGLLSAVPWLAGLPAMFLAARSADRRGRLPLHCALAAAIGAAGLGFSVIFDDHAVWALVGLTVATMGVMASLPVFWGLPTALMGGEAAAAGIALINSFGNLSGFCAPMLVGLIKERTQASAPGVICCAFVLLLGALLVLRAPTVANAAKVAKVSRT
ncbi:MFS transporter [Xylophilus rhododendri]|uniref:MFS transporter n=1 Tax=Xylophilus rhododendri TaxID=2697032 RepID=A0A857J3T0_9BURK|nr:MFS transporter [Xylophilus rhododendri]QHI98426.1 MFS transporter [Xylophilus rhododendri]